MTVVIATSSTLDRLEKESGFRALHGIATRSPDDIANEFKGVRFEEITAPAPGSDEASDRAVEHRFDECIHPLLSNQVPVFVVVERVAEDDVAKLYHWLQALADQVSRIAQKDKLDSPRWRLVLVAPQGLKSADIEWIKKIRGFKLETDAQETLFSRCYHMGERLRVSDAAAGIDTKAIWPEAVSELLLFHHLRSDAGAQPVAKPWMRAWRFGFLMAGEISELETSLRSLQRHAFSRRPLTEDRSVERMSSPATYQGRCEEPPEMEVEPFEACHPGDGLRAIAGSCDPNATHWASESRRLGSEFKAARASAEASGRSSESPASAMGVRQWSAIHKERSYLDWASGGHFAEPFAIGQSVASLREHWIALLEFHAKLDGAHAAMAASAQEFEVARDSYIGFHWRMVIAIVTCLFVGFAIQSLSVTLMPGVATEAATAVVVGLASLLSVVTLWRLERSAGGRARKQLEDDRTKVVQAIAGGIESRGDIASSAERLQRQATWMASIGRIRSVAARLLTIVLDAEDAAALTFPDTACERPAGSAPSLSMFRAHSRVVCPRLCSLLNDAISGLATDSVASNGSQMLADAVDKARLQVTNAWNRMCEGFDRQMVGHFEVQRTWMAVRNATLSAKRELLAGVIDVLMANLEQAVTGIRNESSQRTAPVVDLLFSPSGPTDDLDLLSVRTVRYSQGGVVARPKVIVADLRVKKILGTEEGTVDARLFEHSGSLALGHHEVGIELVIEGDHVVAHEVHHGGGALP